MILLEPCRQNLYRDFLSEYNNIFPKAYTNLKGTREENS